MYTAMDVRRPPPPLWSSPEEEEDRSHKYDQDRYQNIVNLIKKQPTGLELDVLARRVVRASRFGKELLNLRNDSVLHEVIARENTPLAVAIIDTLKPTELGMLDHQDIYGHTPLHIAALKGDSAVATALLEKKKSLARKRSSKGETPLHVAVKLGHQEVFEIIIEMGDENLAFDRTDDGSTILHYAIMRDQTREALAIVRKFPELISTRNAFGASPLQIMAIFFKKQPKTGILISLLYKHLTWKKEQQRIQSGNAAGIKPSNRAKWWSRLSGIDKLRREIAKAREEMSNYKMNMELLELLTPNDGSLSFYFSGSTPQGHSFNSSGGDTMRNDWINTADWPDDQVVQEQVKNSDGAVDADGNIRWNDSPLITGIELGIDDFVMKILQVSPWSATYLDKDRRNVLQAAVKHGRRQVVKAIKKDERIPPWLFQDLEFGTNNSILHIAASNKNFEKEADPLRLQDELEWFEMLEKMVPQELLTYRNSQRKTAWEVFDHEHEATLKDCRGKLATVGQTCSPILAAVVLTSSFYIPGENNRESNRLAFKIFSHVYMVGFSCAATSLVMFLLLAVTPFQKRDFRRKVPWHFVIACFLLAMSLAAFIIAFTCNMYLQIYSHDRKSTADLATLLLELLLVPFLSVFALSLTGVSWTFGTFKRLIK